MSKLDTIANVAAIALCLVIGGDVAYRHLSAPKPRQGASSSGGEASYKEGDQFPALARVDFRRAKTTAVLVIRSTCHFCAESMPFYKRLAASVNARTPAAALVAVCTEAEGSCADFLKQAGVSVAAVVATPPGGLRVRGTPTLLLVNSAGEVSHVWAGKLTEAKETEVLKLVESGL